MVIAIYVCVIVALYCMGVGMTVRVFESMTNLDSEDSFFIAIVWPPVMCGYVGWLLASKFLQKREPSVPECRVHEDRSRE